MGGIEAFLTSDDGFFVVMLLIIVFGVPLQWLVLYVFPEKLHLLCPIYHL